MKTNLIIEKDENAKIIENLDNYKCFWLKYWIIFFGLKNINIYYSWNTYMDILTLISRTYKIFH